jgi:hypothetical protein
MAGCGRRGFERSRRQDAHRRMGEEVQVRRSPQAVACRRRGVKALGRPQTFLPVGSIGVGYTAPEAPKGTPGHGTRLEPQRRWSTRGRQAEKYGDRASPPQADGESYRAEYAAVGKAHDRRKVSTEARRPHRTLIPDMADRISMSQPPYGVEPNRTRAGNGSALRGRECNRGTGCGKTARPGLYGGRRVTGVPPVAVPKAL